MSGRSKILQLMLITFVLGWSAEPARATVRSCVLDGGGAPDRRFCGIERYLSKVRSVYSSLDTLSESVFSADGPAGATPNCVLKPVYTSPDTFTPDTKSYDVTQVPGTSTFPPAEGRQYFPAHKNDLTSSCWKGKAGDKPVDVCHFWGMNHGDTADGESYMTLTNKPGMSRDQEQKFNGDDFRALMDNNASSCGSFRFVTNNCNSGGMMKAIYDKDGKLIPNRCGSASTPQYEMSTGRPITPLEKKEVMAGNPPEKKVVFASPGAKYTYTEAFADGFVKGKAKSLDDAHFYSLMNNPTAEQPMLTSDYYLDNYNKEIEKNDLMAAQKRIAERLNGGAPCYGRFRNGDQFEGVKSLAETCTSAAAKADPNDPARLEMSKQIQGQQERIKEFELHMCGTFSKNMAEDFEREKLDQTAGAQCSKAAEAAYSESSFGYKKQRRDQADKCMRGKDSTLSKTAEENAKGPTGRRCTDLKSDDEKRALIRDYYQLFKKKRDGILEAYSKIDCSKADNYTACTKQTDKLAALMKDFVFTRRYEYLLKRLDSSIAFVAKAPTDKLKEMVLLRKCETGDFNKAVPK